MGAGGIQENSTQMKDESRQQLSKEKNIDIIWKYKIKIVS
jgi:hypothetical protein